ncbi:hypothetical protein G159_11935 [Planococcus glaciei CHR43]|nr:hypothetical protein G159_11935 [Planococcus glaciei CHR43]
MAVFAIAEKTEATSRGWAQELDNKEKRKRLFSSDRRKTIWRSGIFSAAQPKWLTTRGARRCS